MRSLVLLALLVPFAACASQAAPPARSPAADVAPSPPPEFPSTMSRVELDRLVAAQALVPIELEPIESRQATGSDRKMIERPGELVLSQSMPSGSTSAVYADKLRRLWIVTSFSRVHAPPNVIVSATRTFERRFAIPIGYRLVGKIAIADAE